MLFGKQSVYFNSECYYSITQKAFIKFLILTGPFVHFIFLLPQTGGKGSGQANAVNPAAKIPSPLLRLVFHIICLRPYRVPLYFGFT